MNKEFPPESEIPGSESGTTESESLRAKHEAIASFQKLREEALGACREAVEKQGVGDPGDLDTSDPVAQKAVALFQELSNQGEIIRTWEGSDLRHRINLQVTMLYVDAGCAGADYLDRIRTNLFDDAQDVKGGKSIPERKKTREQIKIALARVKALAKKGTPSPDPDYDLSDIDLGKIDEFEKLPRFDLFAALQEANARAAAENPDYKKTPAGRLAVWKYLPDEIKAIWNHQIWNPEFLTRPDQLEHWATLYGRPFKDIPKVTEKVKIDRPR